METLGGRKVKSFQGIFGRSFPEVPKGEILKIFKCKHILKKQKHNQNL